MSFSLFLSVLAAVVFDSRAREGLAIAVEMHVANLW